MKHHQANSKSKQLMPHHVGAVSLSVLLLSAMALFFVALPAVTAAGCSKSGKAAEMVYEVTYNRVSDQVRTGWVWE